SAGGLGAPAAGRRSVSLLECLPLLWLSSRRLGIKARETLAEDQWSWTGSELIEVACDGGLDHLHSTKEGVGPSIGFVDPLIRACTAPHTASAAGVPVTGSPTPAKMPASTTVGKYRY